MESDLIAELERRIADCNERMQIPIGYEADVASMRYELVALTAALTLAKAAQEIESMTQRVRGLRKTQAHTEQACCDGVNHFIDLDTIDDIAREALTLAVKQIGGSDGK